MCQVSAVPRHSATPHVNAKGLEECWPTGMTSPTSDISGPWRGIENCRVNTFMKMPMLTKPKIPQIERLAA
jgi:hypothetical protein